MTCAASWTRGSGAPGHWPHQFKAVAVAQFKAVAVAALRRLQALPHIARGFFGDPDLAYIAAAM